jgi:hypothetical protein
VTTRDDDLTRMDTAGLRITARLERGIQRLGLEAPGEFVAIINAIDMQLESGRPVAATVAHLTDALRALSLARGIDVSRIRLTEHVHQLMQHLQSTAQTR